MSEQKKICPSCGEYDYECICGSVTESPKLYTESEHQSLLKKAVEDSRLKHQMTAIQFMHNVVKERDKLQAELEEAQQQGQITADIATSQAVELRDTRKENLQLTSDNHRLREALSEISTHLEPLGEALKYAKRDAKFGKDLDEITADISYWEHEQKAYSEYASSIKEALSTPPPSSEILDEILAIVNLAGCSCLVEMPSGKRILCDQCKLKAKLIGKNSV